MRHPPAVRHTRRLLLFVVLWLPPAAYAQSDAPARVAAINFESKLVGQALPYHVVLPRSLRDVPR